MPGCARCWTNSGRAGSNRKLWIGSGGAPDQAEQDALKLDLDALVREGARRMLLASLKAEVDEYVAQYAGMRDGRSSPVPASWIQAPRVHDRREGCRFTSPILPPWARRKSRWANWG